MDLCVRECVWDGGGDMGGGGGGGHSCRGNQHIIFFVNDVNNDIAFSLSYKEEHGRKTKQNKTTKQAKEHLQNGYHDEPAEITQRI